MATGDAQSGASQQSTTQTTTTGITSAGYSALAAKGATQKLKITPASIALAMDLGIEDTNSPSFGQSPVRARSNPQTKIPPNALLNPTPETDELASSAAPGVDQTTDKGILNFQLSSIERTPQKTSMRATIETVCSLVAPIVTNALRKMAVVAAVPVTLATVPASIGALRSEMALANYQADFSCLDALIGTTTACSVPATTSLVILTKP